MHCPVVGKELARAGAKGVGRAILRRDPMAQTRRLVFLDDVEALRALAVDLVGQLARLPQREGAADHRIVFRLAVGEVDAPERQFGRATIRPAEAQGPRSGAAGLRLDHQVQPGSHGVGDLAPFRLRGVFAHGGDGELRHG